MFKQVMKMIYTNIRAIREDRMDSEYIREDSRLF